MTDAYGCFPEPLHTSVLYHHHHHSSSCSLLSPVCGGWVYPAQREPSPRCHLLHTPEHGKSRTSETVEGWKKHKEKKTDGITWLTGRKQGSRQKPSSVPELWTSVHQVEDLRWVELLLELSQELHALVVTTLGVDHDEQRAGTRSWGGLPEAWKKCYANISILD